MTSMGRRQAAKKPLQVYFTLGEHEVVCRVAGESGMAAAAWIRMLIHRELRLLEIDVQEPETSSEKDSRSAATKRRTLGWRG